MGVYRRPDSPTWWMSLQVEHRRVRLNTGVDDRRLAEEIFAAWKVEVARERWLGPRPADQQFMVADLIDKYLTLRLLARHWIPNGAIVPSSSGFENDGALFGYVIWVQR